MLPQSYVRELQILANAVFATYLVLEEGVVLQTGRLVPPEQPYAFVLPSQRVQCDGRIVPEGFSQHLFLLVYDEIISHQKTAMGNT